LNLSLLVIYKIHNKLLFILVFCIHQNLVFLSHSILLSAAQYPSFPPFCLPFLASCDQYYILHFYEISFLSFYILVRVHGIFCFCAWLISLNTVSSSFINVVANGGFLWLNNILLYIHTTLKNLFIH
jgi:hypothetical protein